MAVKYNKKPTLRAMQMENLSFCLQFLKQEKIKLVGIGPEGEWLKREKENGEGEH